MSQPTQIFIQPSVLGHYQQLCAAYGTAPTKAQIEEIKLVAGVHKSTTVAIHFEYALLYFLQRSAIVFEEDTLLLGWIHLSDHTRQEIWYKLDDTGVGKHSSRLSFQRGAPRIPGPKRDRSRPFCDEWHPSLAAICIPTIYQDVDMRYAYFISTVRLMRAAHPPPSIEDVTKARPKLSITLRKAVPGSVHGQNLAANPTLKVPVLQKLDTVNAGIEQHTISNQSRPRSRDFIESDHSSPSSHDADLGRDDKRAGQLVVVDLTESDPEEEIKSEPGVSPSPLSDDEHAISSEQRLRDILQSKKVSEIKDTLAQRSGQLPDWIEAIMEQEMEKKMARDLEMVRNFF